MGIICIYWIMRSTARNNEYVVIDCSYDVSRENNNIMTTCTTYFPSLFLYPSSTSSQVYFPLTYISPFIPLPSFILLDFLIFFILQVRAICVLSCSFTLIHCSPAKEDPNPFFMIQHSNHILIALAVASVANAQFIHFESPSDGMYIWLTHSKSFIHNSILIHSICCNNFSAKSP